MIVLYINTISYRLSKKLKYTKQIRKTINALTPILNTFCLAIVYSVIGSARSRHTLLKLHKEYPLRYDLI